MKKKSAFLLACFLFAFFCAPLSALELNSSYRSAATGGMFKQEVDRIYDNPAYIGAALDNKTYIEYDKSLTKEKGNIYTGLNGFNSENTYLLGGSTRLMNTFGIAGMLEVNYNQTPNSISESYTQGGVSVSASGQGEASAGTMNYIDSNADGVWDQKRSLTIDAKDNTDTKIINGILGIGGFNLGGITLGASFFKISDDSETRKRDYNRHYSDSNLLTNYETLSESYTRNRKDETVKTDYVINAGIILAVGSVPVEGILSFELNTEEITDFDEYTTNTTTNQTVTTSAGNIDNEKINNDGYTIGLNLQTRMELLSFNAQPYFKWEMGGNSPFKKGSYVYGDTDSTVLHENSVYVNNISDISDTTYKGDGISKHTLIIGSNFRKLLAPELLAGFGASYTLMMSSNKYKKENSSLYVQRMNDGNGVVDNADYTLTRTGAYTDSVEEKITGHRISLPIGLEYAATETLTFRLGYLFTADFTRTETTSERGDVQARYNDYDYDSVAGNETTYDSLYDETVTADKTTKESKNFYSMTNTYAAGIGYALAGRVQLDFLFTAAAGGNFNNIESAEVMTSATFIF